MVRQNPSVIRLSEKIKEAPQKKKLSEASPASVKISGRVKETVEKQVSREKERAYKAMEGKISAFRLAQIVREREEALDSPHQIYQEAFKKVLSFWESLGKKQKLDFAPLKDISSAIIKNYKNTPAILSKLTKDYPADNYLPYHSLNVGLLTIALGSALKWGGERLEDLALAGLVHDIGMSQIPREIYLKPGGLRRDERAKVEEHPKIALEFLEKDLGSNLIQAVFQHHEHSDGGGYPQGLRGKDIHPGARILALADTYEAMTHSRLYHQRRFSYDVLTELISEKVSAYDKTVLKALIQEITFYPAGSFVVLNTGEIAIVEDTSSENPTRPKVKVLISEGGEKLTPPREVNLSMEKLLYIQRPISAPEKEG